MKQSIRIPILFEDDDIIVVNKPAGMIVHPAPGHETNTLTDALKAHCPAIAKVGSISRPGVVHRLDTGTSGVMVFAKTRAAYLNLREQFESHMTVRKIYLAVLHGAPKPPTGMVNAPIGKKPWDPKRMAINGTDAKNAVSRYQLLAKRGKLAIVEFRIATGRTHQIRVHAAFLGHPIVGDDLYGDSTLDAKLATRPTHPLLHAIKLSFIHPKTNERVTFAAPPPAEILYAG